AGRPGRGLALASDFRAGEERRGPVSLEGGRLPSDFAQSQFPRTRKLTLPLPPGLSDPASVHATVPVAPALGCCVSVQPVMPEPAGAQLAEADTVHGGVASRMTMLEMGTVPGVEELLV